MNNILILNGPNLNLLGIREPLVYGTLTLKDVETSCQEVAKSLNLSVTFKQSNHEGQLIDWVHEAREQTSGIVINPAAFSHTSIALLDALNTYEKTVIEVHISNTQQREECRHHSYVSTRAEGVISGFGVQGYELALLRMARIFETYLN